MNVDLIDDILCNRTNPSRGGLISRTNTTFHSNPDLSQTVPSGRIDGGCNDPTGSTMYVRGDAEGTAYMDQLWAWYVTQSPAVDSGDVNTWDGATGHIAWREEFFTRCAVRGAYVPNDEVEWRNTFSTRVRLLNPDGTITETHVQRRDNAFGSTNVRTFLGNHTCDAIIERINNTASAAQTRLESIFRTTCRDTLRPEVERIRNEAEREENAELFNAAQSILNSNNFVAGNTSTGLRCIDDTELPGLLTIAPPDISDPEDSEGDQPNCFNQLGGLSWLLCPIISLVNSVGDFMYRQVENQLTIDADLIDTSSGTFEAWLVFVNIANVIFVIIFLVIIVSQITGLGVSNYGIKKALPRLVLAAVLINMSFIISQLAVDLSNILGSSLNSMLSGVVTFENAAFGETGGASGVGVFFNFVATAILVGGGALILSGGWMALVGMIFLALIMGVAAIAVIFIILALRQAGVIILIAISPLAFAAFILPNTEKLFQRWLSIFKALLLVFPICGLLMGGARMASNILLNTADPEENSIMMILAFVLPAMSFFLVPMLLKASLAGLGNVGARLSGLGSKLYSGDKSIGKRGQKAIANNPLSAHMKGQKAQRAALRKGGMSGGIRGRINQSLNQNKALNQSKVGKALTSGYFAGRAATGAAVAAKQEREDIAAAEDYLAMNPGEISAGKFQAELEKGDKTDISKAKAYVNKMGTSGYNIGQMRQAVEGAVASGKMSDKTAASIYSHIATGPNGGKIADKDFSFSQHTQANQALSTGLGKKAITQQSYSALSNADFAGLGTYEMNQMRMQATRDGDEAGFNKKVDSILADGRLGATINDVDTLKALGRNADGTIATGMNAEETAQMHKDIADAMTPYGPPSPPAPVNSTPLEGGGKIRRESPTAPPTADFGGSKIHRNSSGEVQTESGIILPGQAASDALNRKKPE